MNLDGLEEPVQMWSLSPVVKSPGSDLSEEHGRDQACRAGIAAWDVAEEQLGPEARD